MNYPPLPTFNYGWDTLLSVAEAKWSWVKNVDEVNSDLRWCLREAIRKCDGIRLEEDNNEMDEVHVATIPMQEMGDRWFVRCVNELLLDT